MKIYSDPQVKKVFNAYPKQFRAKLLILRDIIIDTANELDGIDMMSETLKWGEPSYLVDKGSTLRISWHQKRPDTYSMYFKCTSKLVKTFKLLYSDKFNFFGEREIRFRLSDPIHKRELKKLIRTTLTYHRLKKLPHLGLG
jgi:hypothetical protein